MITKVQKWGNSQGLRLPKIAMASLDLQLGDQMELVVQDGALILTPVHRTRGRFDIDHLAAQSCDVLSQESGEVITDQMGNETW